MNGLDLQIEKLKQSTGLDYVDTVIEYSKLSGLDFEDIAKDLHKSIKDRIKFEFIQRNMVRGVKHISTLEKFF